ncbi:MAG: SPOR domain-containing protein [Rhizobiaceae bacterium]
MVKLIKNYLPKASRGKGKLLLAKRGSTSFSLATIVLPKNGPIPQFRNSFADPASQRVADAHIVSNNDTRLSGKDNGSFQIALIEVKLRELGAKRLPVPLQAPSSGRPDLIQTAAVSNTEAEAGGEQISMLSAYTAPEPKKEKVNAHRSGWQVQIGAVVGEESAYRLLEQARKKAPKILASLDNYTETTEKNGILLHRARFAGLESKSAARSTCKQLKRKKIACLALEN